MGASNKFYVDTPIFLCRFSFLYPAAIIFSNSSIWLLNTLSVSIILLTVLHECNTVAWLRPPIAAPMAANGDLVCCLARYIAI